MAGVEIIWELHTLTVINSLAITNEVILKAYIVKHSMNAKLRIIICGSLFTGVRVCE